VLGAIARVLWDAGRDGKRPFTTGSRAYTLPCSLAWRDASGDLPSRRFTAHDLDETASLIAQPAQRCEWRCGFFAGRSRVGCAVGWNLCDDLPRHE